MNSARKKIATSSFRYIFTNLLAVFLVGLSVAKGTEGYNGDPHIGVSYTTLDFENVDFPTSVSRSSLSSNQSREMLLPVYYLRKEPSYLSHRVHALHKKSGFDSKELDQIRTIVSLVICSNAP